jgi:hypothetical protein
MVKGNSYPISEAQRVTPTLLTGAAKPPVKRTARERAEERWFGTKEKPPPSPSALETKDLSFHVALQHQPLPTTSLG